MWKKKMSVDNVCFTEMQNACDSTTHYFLTDSWHFNILFNLFLTGSWHLEHVLTKVAFID